MNSRNSKTLIAIAAATLMGAAFHASAETNWEKNHPRRAQVNARLANQNHRINKEVREGEISQAKANKLHAEDRSIRKEERTMARLNNSHITKAEQRALNQQENTVSRQIGK